MKTATPLRYNQHNPHPNVTRSLPTRTLPLALFAILSCAASATAGAQTEVAAPAPAGVPAATRHTARTGGRSHAYQPPYNPNVIVLDSAHGAADNGADLGPAGTEKDFNVNFARRLSGKLAQAGFNVVLTHPEAGEETSPDARVELANRSRAVACLLLHASTSGHGVHLYTSSINPPATAETPAAENAIQPWDSAQAGGLDRSQELANELASALNGLSIPLVVGRVAVRPIDSLSCAAVAVEISPERPKASLRDEAYLDQVSSSISSALVFWRQHAQAQIAAQIAAQAPAQTPSSLTQGSSAPGSSTGKAPSATPSWTKPKAKPVLPPPDEVPLDPGERPGERPGKPAPIERRPPATQTGADPAGTTR